MNADIIVNSYIVSVISVYAVIVFGELYLYGILELNWLC